MCLKERAWIEVDLDNLKWNVLQIKKILHQNTKIMAVVKANAYGHGIRVVIPELIKVGIHDFAVATLSEAIELRKLMAEGTILILGYTLPEKAYLLEKFKLTQSIIDFHYAQKLELQKMSIDVHIAINTGMNRIGINCNEKGQIMKIVKSKCLNVTGIYSHLCVADSFSSDDVEFTKFQISKFMQLNSWLKANGYNVPIHIQSSYGIINYSHLECDYVRPGIILYGCYSDNTKGSMELKPVLSLKSRVIEIRSVDNGQSVGYGRAYKIEGKKQVAVIAIGYADGVPRNINYADVLIRGKRFRIIGRICMDQLMVELEENCDMEIGDEAVLIGKSGNEEISVEDFSFNCDTISNEILSRIGNRLPRIIKNEF